MQEWSQVPGVTENRLHNYNFKGLDAIEG